VPARSVPSERQRQALDRIVAVAVADQVNDHAYVNG
jgi:hypothetical protein